MTQLATKGRLMFAIIENKLILGLAGDKRAHIEWFVAQGWLHSYLDQHFETIVRGFVNGYGVFAYRGQDFISSGVIKELIPILEQLQQQLALPNNTKVWVGPFRLSENHMVGQTFAGEIGYLVQQQREAAHV